MEMTLILVNLGLAFIFGIYLSFHFFFYRLKIGKPWRWLGGIVGGLIVGTLMAIIDFWIIWPPASILSVVVGFALMLLIVKILIGYPKLWQSDK
ncbi:MAG: hypothetical protein WA131_07450 [Desulfitobacteriaceae bacterium]